MNNNLRDAYVNDFNTPPSPLMPYSPTPPYNKDFFENVRKKSLESSRQGVVVPTPVSYIDVTQINNSYTASQSPPLDDSVTPKSSSFKTDAIQLIIEKGKLKIYKDKHYAPLEIPLVNIKDVCVVNKKWIVYCKDTRVIELGINEEMGIWIKDGLRTWDFRGGLQTSMNGKCAYDINSLYTCLGCLAGWSIQTFNEGYKICESYPRQIIFPTSVTEQEVILSAQNRVYNRFPIFCWMHRINHSPLLRASVPVKGHYSDTHLIYSCSRKRPVIVIDCVSKLSRCEVLPQLKIQQTLFPSHRILLQHYHQFLEAMENPNTVLSSLNNLEWIQNICNVLESSDNARIALNSNNCVVVTSSDGLGSVSVLTSIIISISDPYFRTIEGLISLIEKEWVLVGYPFAQCIGINSSNSEAVAFLLFIHCLKALIKQNPTLWEITADGLMIILDELYKGECNTFLFNCEKERRRYQVDDKTLTLYDVILQKKNNGAIINPNFDRLSNEVKVLSEPLSIPVWTKYFYRYLHPHIAELDMC
ncbi:Myotubularin [Entamoeba marina]